MSSSLLVVLGDLRHLQTLRHRKGRQASMIALEEKYFMRFFSSGEISGSGLQRAHYLLYSVRYKPKGSSNGRSEMKNKKASSSLEGFSCRCQLQFGTTK